MYSIGDSSCTKFVQIMRLRWPLTFFTIWLNLSPSCWGNTGKMLHGIYRYAITVLSGGLMGLLSCFLVVLLALWSPSSTAAHFAFCFLSVCIRSISGIHSWGHSVQLFDHHITKTRLYIIDPLKPHFYIVKMGFTGVYIIFLSSAQKHRLWVLVRTASPRRF